MSLSDNNQTDIIEAFNSTSRYLDDLFNIDNPYFEQMVGQIYPAELQLNKANSSDTEARFLDLNLSLSNGIVSSKIYDKRDDFNFEIVNFPFLDGDVPRSPSYGVYISQLIRFARVCSNVDDFNNRNLLYPPQTLFVVGILFSRCPSVCASVRPSVTLCFLNILKSHGWIFIKPCKHVHICKTNTLNKKVRARGQSY